MCGAIFREKPQNFPRREIPHVCPAPNALMTEQPTPPARVSRTGTPLLKPAGGPPSLTKRHQAFIRYLVFGLEQRYPRWPDVEPFTPLDINTAADVACLRRKNARDLFNWPIFLASYNAAVAALRKNEHARSLHTMIAIRDDPGLGKAADRKVQLTAAAALIGEANGKPSNTVNVNIGATQITAGIVIDLRDDEPTHPTTIDHEDTP